MENLGTDLPDSAASVGRTHPLAGAVAGLRRFAFVLLLAGAAEIPIWFGNIRVSGAPAGAFTSIAIGVIAGTFFLAAALTVIAFVVDLLIHLNSGTKDPGTAEHRPLTTA
jgi:hypothetical protein